jgi:hypothetical protein
MYETSYLMPPVSPTAQDASQRLKALMQASWKVMEKAHYTRGHVFSEDGQWIETIAKAFNYMTDIHGRDHWEPSKPSRLVQPTDENIAAVRAEKQQAVDEVRGLRDLMRPETLGIPQEMVDDYNLIFEFYEYYIRGYQLFCEAVFLGRKAQVSGAPDDAEAALASLPALHAFRRELIERLEGTTYPHYVYWILDESRVTDLIADIEAEMAGVTRSNPVQA